VLKVSNSATWAFAHSVLPFYAWSKSGEARRFPHEKMQTTSDFGSLDKKSQKEVQTFIEQQQQMQQIQSIVGKITELCWDKCVSKPGKDLTDSEKLVTT
jgi:hypothetical protein